MAWWNTVRGRLLPAALGFSLLLAAPSTVLGQAAGSVQVVRLHDLAFGIVPTGMSRIVAPTASEAGKFEIRGPAGTRVSLIFHLPQTLAGESAFLGVEFTPGSAAWAEQDDITGAMLFDPRRGLQVTLPSDGTIYLWIGGRLSVPNSLPSARYESVVLVTAIVN